MKYRTGDLILFSGRCKIAWLIRLITWGRWSHVGVVIADDPKYNFPLLYEATHDNTITGLDIGRKTIGVQVVPLDERIKAYNGDIAIRRVKNPCYTNRHKARLYRMEHVGVGFESSIVQILAAAWAFKWLRQGECLDELFCTEHVAQYLKELGWLDSEIPSNHYCPKFFATTDVFLNGVSYGEIEILKRK